MPAIMTLQDLLVHQLRDIYSAEKQLVAALPKMAKKCTSDELREAVTTHLQQTEEQVDRLEQVFTQLGVSGRGPKCAAMEGLIEEAKELMEEDIDPNVLDAGIIASAQRVEHYEIAVYGTVIEFARALGHSEVVELLQTTLDEEKETNDNLTGLAEGGINALAEHNEGAGMSDDEDEDDAADDSEEPSESGTRGAPRGAKKAASKSSTGTGRTATKRR